MRVATLVAKRVATAVSETVCVFTFYSLALRKFLSKADNKTSFEAK